METGLLYRWWSSSVSVDEGSEAANQPSLPLHDLRGSEEVRGGRHENVMMQLGATCS